MKLVSLMLVIMLSLLSVAAFAQSTTTLPPQAAIFHFTLPVSYYKTTVLIFPAAIDTADRGSSEIIAEKQAKLENVLKVKAAYQGFAATNLHVFTVDHRMYAFDVIYSDSPRITTFDLSKLSREEDSAKIAKAMLPSKRPLTNDEWAGNAALVKQLRPGHLAREKKDGIKVYLDAICQQNGILYFSFRIINTTNLPYTMLYANLVLRDKRNIRRSSAQERQLMPVYSDPLVTVPSKTFTQWTIAVPQFGIPRHRRLTWQLSEKGGEGNLIINIINRQLFTVKKYINVFKG